MEIEHRIVFESLELVRKDGQRIYVVDRERQQLKCLDQPHRILSLVQRQSGRRADGELELLERYVAEDDGESVVLDSSPVWLEELRKPA